MHYHRIRPIGAIRSHSVSRSKVVLALISLPVLLLGLAGTALASDYDSTLWQRYFTVEYITEQLAERFEEVHDITANITYIQVSSRDGSKSEGQLQLLAIFPDLVRATWVKPDLLSGILWIADTE